MAVSVDLRERIADFARLRVLVVGEAILDSYLHGTADRLCREAPVPVVALERRVDEPGGAANTAVNAGSLGGQVTFLSVIGDDPEGELLKSALEGHGIGTEHLLCAPSRRTLAKHRVLAGDQLVVRFDQGSMAPLDERTERALIERFHDLFPRHDAVIVSDYCYGVLTPRIIESLAALQARDPRVLVVDARDLRSYRQVGATAVKPNYEEVLRLLGQPAHDVPRARVDWVAGQGDRLLEASGARIVAATLDVDGALLFERGSSPYRTYTRPAALTHATGAGDTFTAAFALALAADAQAPEAAELAAAAAAIVVAQDGTTACAAAALQEWFGATTKYAPNLESLLARVAFYRQQGCRIVFTNGCFDILHRGHVTFLTRAKALGDVLIVGLNSNASIARLKGPERPINALEDRAQVLAALSCVDHMIAFDDDTPVHLLREIKPDLFVKGGDYTRERVPEAPLVEVLGGEVCILPYLESFSTTKVISKIRATGGLVEVDAIDAKGAGKHADLAVPKGVRA